MSLTTLLKNNDVKDKFADTFPMPEFKLKGDMLAPPQTKNYPLIGTAFDYLMRFYLKKINNEAVTKDWVAEHTINCVDDTKLRKKIKDILADAKSAYNTYLKTGEMNDNIIKSAILLAQLDPIFRAGYIDPNIGIVNPQDIADMKNLIRLVDPKKFKCSKYIMLNPTFGEASALVGGADMDILLDNVLIDIKTTKNLDLSRDYLNQIIGYYILYLIGGIDNMPKEVKIEYLGIYYSRHGLLYKIPIREVTKNCDMKKFIKWFIKRAEQEMLGRIVEIK